MHIESTYFCNIADATSRDVTFESRFQPVTAGTVVYDAANSRFGVVVKLSTSTVPYVYSTSGMASLIDDPGLSTVDVAFARMYMSELLTHHGDRTSTPVVNVVAHQLVSFRRLMCNDCMFSVNPVDHFSRCSPSSSFRDSHAEDGMRRRAWIGDVVHTMDVRRHLLGLGVPVERLQVMASELLSRAAQAAYYDTSVSSDSHVSPVRAATGTSEARRSTAFEASYCGDYRRDYCARVLSFVPVDFVSLEYDDLFE